MGNPDRGTRGRAIGTWAAVAGLALPFGPVIGGILVALGSWRGVFWVNVAAASLMVILAVRTVPESSSPQTARLDVPGFVAGAVGLGAMTFAVILGETDGYRNSLVIGLFLIGVVAIVGFVHIERASKCCPLDSHELTGRRGGRCPQRQWVDQIGVVGRSSVGGRGLGASATKWPAGRRIL